MKNTSVLDYLEKKLTSDEKRELLSQKTKEILKDKDCYDFSKKIIN